MKPRILIQTVLLSITPAISHAGTFEEVAVEGAAIGTTYLFDGNASTGGGDFDTTGSPETGIFTRNWSLATQGTTGIDVSVTGLAFGLPGASNTDGNVITATITYLGADGIAGGGDDVVLGSTKGTLTNFTTNGLGRYEWLFDSPIAGTIDGANGAFSVTLESLAADNSGNTYNSRFKTTTGTTAGNVKMDVAGTSTTSGTPLPDTDSDGLLDNYETNTGIYISKYNSGTNPADSDTDDDGLLDGVETNTRKYVSVSDTGTNPNDSDCDNDGLLDGVETNTLIYTNASNTGTNPFNRDGDSDALSDKFEVDNGLDPFVNADFDGDGSSDRFEVLFYGSNPKLDTSFPDDGIHPAPLSFTLIVNSGYDNLINAGSANPLGATILNEALLGGAVDGNYETGVTDFAMHFANVFPAAGSEVSINSLAWAMIASSTNLAGDFRLDFYDPGADGVFDGVDQETLLGTAKGTLNPAPSVSKVAYLNFAPINFTSSGTGLVIKIQSTNRMRIKAENNNFGSGLWRTNDGFATFGTNRSTKVSIGGSIDGYFSSWQAANSTAGMPDDDHDGDGVKNGVEYFLGGGTSTNGFNLLPGVTNTGGTLSTTWAKAADYTGTYGTHFVVETSATLDAGSWVPAAQGAGPNQVEIIGNDVKFTFPSGTENFARLKVTGP